MVRLVDNRNGMVAEVLKGRVDNWVVGTNKAELKSPVQVHTVTVEEEGENPPEHIKINWHNQRDDENRGCSYKLIHPFIRNDSKRTWIVEGVVVLVDVPEKLETVANVVVGPFE